MKIEGQAQLLRIFIGESDHCAGKPLYEAIVLAAREAGLAGATVLRGLEGFGAHSRIHTRGSCACPRTCDRGRDRRPRGPDRGLPAQLDAMVTEGW